MNRAAIGVALVLAMGLACYLRGRLTTSCGSDEDHDPPGPVRFELNVADTAAFQVEPPASPTRAAAEEPRVLRILDCGSRPIVGLQAFLRIETAEKDLGTTSAAGEVSIAHLAIDDAVEIRLAGKQVDGVHEVSWNGARVATLKVGAQAWLSGSLCASDRTPLANLDVIAIPWGVLRTIRSPAELLAAPECRRTASDIHGEFTLCELDDGVAYELLTGGKGYLQKYVPHFQASRVSSAMNLMLFRAYSCSVVAKDQDGNSISQPKYLVFGGLQQGMRMRIPDELEKIDWSNGLLVSDLGPEFFINTRDRAACLFVKKHQIEPLPTVHVDVNLVGYETGHAELELCPVPCGRLPTEIRLARVDRAVGTLRVKVSGEPSCARHQTGTRPQLELRPRIRADGQGLTLELIPDSDGTCLLEGIPWGDYRAVVTAGASTIRIPSRAAAAPFFDVKIGSREAVLDIDLSGTGCMELLAMGPDGKPFDGALSVEIHPDPSRPRVGNFVSLSAAPYILTHIAPGDYRIEVRSAWEGWTATEDVHVNAGEQSELSMTLGY